MITQELIVGIDASRNRSGGAKAHLIGILSEINPCKHGICEVHVWTYRSLLDMIPERPWLIKHCPRELGETLPKQIWWQASKLKHEAANAGCDILFTTDASTFCRFKPMVVLSQDMLSYEPGVMQYFGFTMARLRLLAILLLQNRAMKFADGVIFLTKYAAEVIQKSCGHLNRIKCIPHGVGSDFGKTYHCQVWPENDQHPVQCMYVSNAAMYKHQKEVVKAVATLKRSGFNLRLTLVGGGAGKAQELLDSEIAVKDPDRAFITQMDFVPHKELPALLASANIFIFASSCENMPVTLVEAMAIGLPIACSNRGPMPEVLQDGGIYFDPENPESIVEAIEQIIKEPAIREKIAGCAKNLAGQYSWSRCSRETFSFIVETYKDLNRG